MGNVIGGSQRFELKVSSTTAVAGSLALSFFFVGSLHLWKLVGYEDKNRDATGTIQRRWLSTVLTSFCSVGLVYSLARPIENPEGLTFLDLFGLQGRSDVGACLFSLTLTAILFVGPLIQHLLAVADGEYFISGWPGGNRWIALRNLVLAPIAEEFVFRTCLVRLWVGASFSWRLIIFVSPFMFALAHTHHFLEHVRNSGNKKQALTMVAFQVFYTSLFGMYCNFLLLRTGSTLAVILNHSFCNHQGFPDVSALVNSKHGHLLRALYGVGIIGFIVLIGPLTAGFHSSYRA